MPPIVADDDQKRRARRRLIGAVALTIIAVIVVPLVLEDEPPPAGPLEIQMPTPATTEQMQQQGTAEQAMPPAFMHVPDESSESDLPAPVKPAAETSQTPKPQAAVQFSAPAPAKQADTAAETVYTVQVGVFADAANVQKLEPRIAALGYRPQTDVINGSTRIRVGAFKNRADAERVMSKLADAGIPARVVEK